MPASVSSLPTGSAWSRARTIRRNYYFNLCAPASMPRRSGQMPFTPPVQVLYALNRALDEYFEETGARRRARYTASWEALVAGLSLRLELLLPLEQHSRILTAVLEPSHPNYSFQTMHDELYARGFTIYPGIIPDLHTFRLANLGRLTGQISKPFSKCCGPTWTNTAFCARLAQRAGWWPLCLRSACDDHDPSFLSSRRPLAGDCDG